ncbi:unnamed protein product [Soboliphyme baturini]|uniref:Glyco_hydro_19_cat domain-containing protein n=1 Tax=Soboliphyme baturini TaxID=241478 RepID=A0A183IQX8_9BILA|nr:unnamed protein product [Soboliphyme baturini]
MRTFGIWLSLCLAVGASASNCKTPCQKGYKCMIDNCVLDVMCPAAGKYGPGPPKTCAAQVDPLNKPKSPIETWFTEEVFNDLFPKANIGWGPSACSPYNYEAFIIAARYFPKFGTEAPNNGYTATENARRDLAAFFAHAVQETGENDASLYGKDRTVNESHACFYRGGFYNWFEGGPVSSFLPPGTPGNAPEEGEKCNLGGKYCSSSAELDYFYPCNTKTEGNLFYGCYFGRGAIQLSYNFNYGIFTRWLQENNINVDLLQNPNLLLTKRDPPLAILGSLWFYMTPQPPKPAMHDIMMGNWEPGPDNRAKGYIGPIFGPTSLIINNECNGEDPQDPGGPGESRRIKAFKWLCEYFGVKREADNLLTCKGMPKTLDMINHNLTWQPDWSMTWKDQPCDCAPASYGGMIPYFQPGYYPQEFVDKNPANRLYCVKTIYDNPKMYSMEPGTSKCLNFKMKEKK